MFLSQRVDVGISRECNNVKLYPLPMYMLHDPNLFSSQRKYWRASGVIFQEAYAVALAGLRH